MYFCWHIYLLSRQKSWLNMSSSSRLDEKGAYAPYVIYSFLIASCESAPPRDASRAHPVLRAFPLQHEDSLIGRVLTGLDGLHSALQMRDC